MLNNILLGILPLRRGVGVDADGPSHQCYKIVGGVIVPYFAKRTKLGAFCQYSDGLGVGAAPILSRTVSRGDVLLAKV